MKKKVATKATEKKGVKPTTAPTTTKTVTKTDPKKVEPTKKAEPKKEEKKPAVPAKTGKKWTWIIVFYFCGSESFSHCVVSYHIK